ncbi:hypothetical protein HR12_36045 [Microbacterium sp. SUBG005]|nr:hypothetical protein HR12_36045 [Microbacterium sp. SUBG005]
MGVEVRGHASPVELVDLEAGRDRGGGPLVCPVGEAPRRRTRQEPAGNAARRRSPSTMLVRSMTVAG